jgi:hypothetical protein
MAGPVFGWENLITFHRKTLLTQSISHIQDYSPDDALFA